MSFWGKIIGGVAGLALGGPFGALIGVALGHQAEEGLTSGAGGGATLGGGGNALRMAALLGRAEEVFAICVVVLSAKLAKADGAVNRAEIAAFRQHFQVPPQSARDIGRLFDTARESPEGFEPYATQLGETFADRPGVLEDVLAALFAIARADKPVTVAEQRFLQTVCHRFGLGEQAWMRASGAAPRMPPAARSDVQDAYGVLGVPRSASNESVRERWLSLVREGHPDRLASRGIAADLLARAGERMARINAAWDAIKRERGL